MGLERSRTAAAVTPRADAAAMNTPAPPAIGRPVLQMPNALWAKVLQAYSTTFGREPPHRPMTQLFVIE